MPYPPLTFPGLSPLLSSQHESIMHRLKRFWLAQLANDKTSHLAQWKQIRGESRTVNLLNDWSHTFLMCSLMLSWQHSSWLPMNLKSTAPLDPSNTVLEIFSRLTRVQSGSEAGLKLLWFHDRMCGRELGAWWNFFTPSCKGQFLRQVWVGRATGDPHN